MKITEILSESLSKQVFHFTTAATQILTSGKFQLSSVLGSIEQGYAPKGYPYFLSTTRTRHGGYHAYTGSYGALFVLDGNWFNNKYLSKPVDYWGDRDPAKQSYKAHEAEDRVFSKEPTIPIGGVTAVHFYLDPAAEGPQRARVRQGIIAAKKRGIPTYFYTDLNAWKNFDTRHQGDLSILTGAERTRNPWRPEREWLLPWIELIHAKSKSQLSKKADDIRYSLRYSYNKGEIANGLKNDLSNARKPGSGLDRAHVIKIINYMKQHKLTTVNDFVNHLAEKWKNL